MKMKCKKLTSLLLSFVMVLGMLPAVAPHAHAEEYTWNPNATMTLKCGDEVVEPKEVIETADTKMKVYQINSISDYTLTTSTDNDYAVMFEVNWSVISEDEDGYKDYDYEMTVTLDNVTIRTYNPRVDQNEKIHAAMTFSDEKCEERYETLNIQLVGDNTVELLGVKDDSAEDRWSAVSFIGPNTVIKGEGTLNATARYSNAVGAVSALYTENSVGLYDTVTLNATADVKAKEAATLIGDGLYFDDYEFIMEAGTTTNIKASGSGIMHGTEHVRAKWLDNMSIDGDLDIRAADYGISWQAGRIYMGDGANLSIRGLSDASAPNVGILARRAVDVGAGCTLKVDALGSAISCRAVTTANPSAPLTVGKNSVVELSGSVDSNVFVLDCGTKLAGTNNVVSGNGEEWFGESYPVSELTLEEGAKLTINGGYLALRAALMELKNGSELDIRTDKYPESDNVEESMAVYISTNRSYVRNGAKLNIEVASDYAIYGFTSLYLESNKVYLKSAESALYSGLGMYRGTDPVIYTFESDDGISWIPFANKNSKPYFTTQEPATHVCAASRTANTYSDKVWTPIENEDKHTAKCIYCAADIVADCQWDRGAWYYEKVDGEYRYVLKFECEVCERLRASDVEYHSHAYETWTPLMGDYYPMHESTCTVEGCGASTEEYCSNYYGEEYHVGLTTLRKDCTRCGQYTTWEMDGSVTVSHISAKVPTCSAPGHVEFWLCGHCGQYYADENCTTVLSPADVFLPPVPHSYGEPATRSLPAVDRSCTVCGEKVIQARFEETSERYFGSEDDYLYVLAGKDADGNVYVMGEAIDGFRREAVKVDGANIDQNGVLTLRSDEVEFMDFEYYFEDGAGASTTSTFTVDGGYMTVRNGKVYVFPKERLDDPSNPRPFDFQHDYSDDTIGLGSVEADLYDPKTYKHDCEYMTFNAETLCFEACESEEYTVYLYREICDHLPEDMIYSGDAPTCTEQGIREHWSCGKCGKLFSDGSATTPYEFPEYVDPDSYRDVNEYFLLPALGHRFGADDTCENCGMKRPVYTLIPSLEAFDQLSEDASYIIVFKDEETGKTYAARLPEMVFPCDADTDGNGVLDLAETDANENGFPDSIEDYIDTYWGGADMNEDGVTTDEEYKEALGDYDGDDDMDVDDCLLFVEQQVHWELHMAYEEQAAQGSNFVEVTVSDDGSITITDEGAMEFQMMESGVWGGQSYDDESLEYDKAHNGVLETDRLRAAWVPNYWVANDGGMGYYDESHFMTQERWYGDGDAPGIIDNKNWKIRFNHDSTVLMVSSWTDLEDTGALQLAKYTNNEGNADMTIVGFPEWQWEYSDIMNNRTALLPAYLYASEPVYDVPPHECIWGSWEADDAGRTHTRYCTVEGCTKKQTESHNWDDGVQSGTPTCTEGVTTTYTCADCGAVRIEAGDPLGHDWSDWTYDSVDSHIRFCKRNCGIEEESGGHEWGDWTAVDGDTHEMVCSVCQGKQTGEHDWDAGVVEPEATCTEPGTKTYTCSVCEHTKTEQIPALGHSYERTVIQAPTCSSVGQMHQHCPTCGDEQYVDMPIDPEAHEWGEWETTKRPTYSSKGEETRICRLNPEHIQTREISALYCVHTCAVCGGCTADDTVCAKQPKCRCADPSTLLVDDGEGDVVGHSIELVDPGQTVSIQVQEVILPSASVSAAGQPVVNPYEEFILNNAEGMKVETCFEIKLKIDDQTYELGEDETATVRLFVGADYAQAIEEGRMFLIHIVGVETVTYGAGHEAITVEKDSSGYTGYVTFSTDGFSPFVLVSLPGELEIGLNAVGADNTSTVSIIANKAFQCSLLLAAYDADGRMLAVRLVDSCNLAAAPQYTLEFSGTAACVKAFMMETDDSFTPRSAAAADEDLTS